jgi:hypothetical protein
LVPRRQRPDLARSLSRCLENYQELIAVSERVFTVSGSVATPAQPITLAEAGLRERSDLQEWVLAHPEILGEGVLVVTFEFDRWQAYGGARERDRLDVFAWAPMAGWW